MAAALRRARDQTGVEIDIRLALRLVPTSSSRRRPGAKSLDKREGSGVTAPVLSDGSAAYTPGVSRRASQEDASGLKLLGHRYYDASTGRFLTRDHAQDGRNWYVYCEGNPVRAVDPTGTALVWIVATAVVAAVALVMGFKNLFDEGEKKVAPALKKSLDDAASPDEPAPTQAYPKEFRDWNMHIGEYVGDVAKDQHTGPVVSNGLDKVVEGAGDVYDLLSGIATIIKETLEKGSEDSSGK